MRSWGLDRFRRLRDAACRETAGDVGNVPTFRRYEVRGLLGEGATSVVYRAWDRELQRPVALKVLRPVFGSGDLAEQRFRREAQAAAGLSHSNLIGIYDAGQEGGAFFIVMEVVEGRSLGDHLRTARPGDREIAVLLEKAARGVAAAHAKGIVHRDLKPANILVSGDLEPKVTDFGLALLADAKGELTRTGTRVGTPLYMAPEQVDVHAGAVSPATDVYALGAILYEALTGRPPHTADGVAELFRRIIENDPVRPGKLNARIGADLETVILKAIEKEPARRYATAGELAEDLRRFLEGEPVLGRPAPLRRKVYRKIRKHPWTAGLCGALVVASALILGVWRNQGLRAGGERESRLKAVRELARLSVDSALRLRRAGDNPAMRRSLPPLESAYRQALEDAPHLPEVEYLMGRMHRALIEDDRALEFQERALSKDPEYAPALYEHAVLASRAYGRGVGKALNTTLVWVHSARLGPVDRPLQAERARPSLRELRERIIRDCEALTRVVREGRDGRGIALVSGANAQAAEAILLYQLDRLEEAERLLRAALAQDALMEEAWETLAQTLEREADLLEKEDEKEAKWDEAEKVYGEGLAHDKGYLPLLWGRGKLRANRALRRRHRDPSIELPELARAEQDYQTALGIDPESAHSWELLGNVRGHRGFCRLHGGQDPLVDFGQADRDLSEALRRKGTLTEAWIWRGIVRNHTGVYLSAHGRDPLPAWKSSEEDLGRAIEVEANDPDAWLERGILRTNRAIHSLGTASGGLEAFDGAEKDLTESLRLNPASGETWSARGKVRDCRGQAYQKSGKVEEARQDFLRAASDYETASRLDASEERNARQPLAALRARLAELKKE